MVVAEGGGSTGIVEVYSPACSQTQTARNMKLAISKGQPEGERKVLEAEQQRYSGPARDHEIGGGIERTGGKSFHSTDARSEATDFDGASGSHIENGSQACWLALAEKITCPAVGLRHGGGAEARACT